MSANPTVRKLFSDSKELDRRFGLCEISLLLAWLRGEYRKVQNDRRSECGRATNSLIEDPRYDGPTEIYTGNERGDR